ncbi:MAG: histidine ammonia-lyase [Gemmatimonadetes bacterium]|nr:histidine ammonia-lyase [Gemmatimonadota bacterium]
MIEIDGNSLTIEQVTAVARAAAPVAPLSESVRAEMTRSMEWLRGVIERDERTIYGVNTGFGPLANRRIRPEETSRLSRNLVLNCLAGVGDPLPEEIVRAMMLVRANSLAKGLSGVRPELAETLIEMLNRGVTPEVPCKGSLGASGDLAPQAHIAVVLLAEPAEGAEPPDGGEGFSGHALYGGERLIGEEAMSRAGLARIRPEAKDGLALTNGTDFMVGTAALAVADAESLLSHAEIAAALSLEALCALSAAFHPALQEASGQPGQMAVAARLRSLFAGSDLIDTEPDRVQDAYSLRCVPQVLGPPRDLLGFLGERVTTQLNAASDNPLVFMDLPGQEPGTLSGGNFHGQGPALWLDVLGIAMADVGGIAERRIFRLLTAELSGGLPAMLIENDGLDSGLMVVQYTAAALVSDNKTLAHPDSVDSVPSSGNQEDHVSMGANAARHAREIVENVRTIVAIELMTAAQAIDLRRDGPSRLGRATRVAYGKIRERVSKLERDRQLSPDIGTLVELIYSRELLEAVEAVEAATP